MDIILKTKTHLYEKDGHVFYNITGTQIDYTLDGLKLRLDGLFDGVKELGMWMYLISNYTMTWTSLTRISILHFKRWIFNRGQHKSIFEWGKMDIGFYFVIFFYMYVVLNKNIIFQELATSFRCAQTNHFKNHWGYSACDPE